MPQLSWAQAPAWEIALSSEQTTGASGTAITRGTVVNAAGDVLLVGHFSGQVAFGSTTLVSAGFNDVFIAKWNAASGAWVWAVRAGGTGSDQGWGIAVSGSSVYVTGYVTNSLANSENVQFGNTALNGTSGFATRDVFVAKYTDVGGNVTYNWAVTGGGASNDTGNGVAVSGSSVYITGNVTNNLANAQNVQFGNTALNGAGATSGLDVFVVKYTDAGSNATYNWASIGGGAGDDIGNAIVADANSVYVTGAVTNNSSNSRAVQFGGVTVNGASTAISWDAFLVKYTDAGNSTTCTWATTGGGTGADQGNNIALNGSSVYITGTVTNTSANSQGVQFGGMPLSGSGTNANLNMFTAKYTDAGSGVSYNWAVTGGGSGNDISYDVAVDGTSVYVTGYVYNDSADGQGVRFGNIPLSGKDWLANADAFVAKYTDAGNNASCNWVTATGGASAEIGYSLAVGRTALYVNIAIDIYSYRFDTEQMLPPNSTVQATLDPATGAWQYASFSRTAPGTAITQATAANAAGDVFSVGYFSGQVVFGNTTLVSEASSDVFVAKWSSTTGTWAWAVSGGGGGGDMGFGIAVSGNSVYATGFVAASADFPVRFGEVSVAGASATSGLDVFVVKYTDAGSSAICNWAMAGGGADGDVGNGIAVSGSSVYVTGYITNNSANSKAVQFGGVPLSGASATSSVDAFLVKYTDTGNGATYNWAVAGGGTNSDQGIGIAVNGTSVYMVGIMSNTSANSQSVQFGGVPLSGSGTSTNQDVFITKYTDAGNSVTYNWGTAGGGAGIDGSNSIAVSGTTLYVGGYANNNSNNANGVQFGGVTLNGASSSLTADAFIAKYTDAGSHATGVWAVAGGGTGADRVNRIALNGNNLYVSGNISTTSTNAQGVRFGGVALSGSGTTANLDVFVAKYTDAGSNVTYNWATAGGGAGTDLGASISYSNNQLVIGGAVALPAAFGSISLSGTTTQAAFLAKLTLSDPSISAFNPNPAGVGQLVTVTGSNLSGVTALTVNGVDATPSLTNNTATSISFRVPSGTPTSGITTLSTTAGSTTSTLFQTVPAPGNALAFDGLDDYVSVPASPAFRFGTGDFTIEAWVRTAGTSGTYVAVGSTGNGEEYWLGMTNQHAALSVSGGIIVEGASVLNDNHWHHLAGVRDGGQLTIYVDGVAERTLINNRSASPLAELGIGHLGGGSYWPGRIDEVRIYNAALSLEQLQTELRGVMPSQSANLQLYLNFDAGILAAVNSGANAGLTTLYDLSPNAYVAALSNFALSSGNTTSNWVSSYALVVPVATAASGTGANEFTASWTAPAFGTVTSYVLDVSTTADFATPVAGSPFLIAAPASNYVVTGLPDTVGSYFYRVRATNNVLGETGPTSNVVTVATPLPVELTSFTATRQGQTGVRLAWMTAQEKNSAYFQVERSLDGRTFTALGMPVAAVGTSTTQCSYHLIDTAFPANARVLYYRLRIVDQDATFAYSNVQTVHLGEAMARLVVYPNPAPGAATLTGAYPGAEVEVLDTQGHLLLRAKADAAGAVYLRLPVRAPAGVYMVRSGSKAVRLINK
ncbi:hypothetical protein LJ737_00910 [Hymenobacter sp. 15J16-1T3B]|uniref:LamG-like jellyroll fold domain-containing protein n=1 Tax=Hymenobacter sp. 15J16-1T3B TaxID=2886941 RepID=UPI001D11944C|nr:LamG-like jellyroll fold domain-containing protein [Hymenobacter sp. 15J16-1T3B]MCC3155777.1 hypothetical protein [Hymenobacter sp. 15J16-1T3B]